MAPKNVSEQVCFSEPNRPPIFVSYKKTEVTYLETLQRGDHIAWESCLGIYDHHGIVAGVNIGENELDVIHNTFAKEEKAANGGAKCKIQQEKVKVDLRKEVLYLCNYEPGECLEPDDVIAKAESLLEEKNYNLFTNNCEHFATFCKTLRRFSKQVTSFVDGVRGFCSVVAKGVADGSKSALEKYAAGKFLLSTAESALSLTKAGIKAIGIGGAAALNFVVEGAVFGVKTYNAYKEWKTGDINEKEFRVKRADAGWSSGIRCVCSTFGGFVGQALIPIPYVGGLIGCVVGALAGHGLAILGRLCFKKWF